MLVVEGGGHVVIEESKTYLRFGEPATSPVICYRVDVEERAEWLMVLRWGEA